MEDTFDIPKEFFESKFGSSKLFDVYYLALCKTIGSYLVTDLPSNFQDELRDFLQKALSHFKISNPEALVYIADMACLSHNQAACIVGENEELLDIICGGPELRVISALGLFTNEKIRERLAAKALPKLARRVSVLGNSQSYMFDLLGACKNILYVNTGDKHEFSVDKEIAEDIMSGASFIIAHTTHERDIIIRAFAMVFYLLNRLKFTTPGWTDDIPSLVEIIRAGLTRHTHDVQLLSALTDLLRFVPPGNDTLIYDVYDALSKILYDLRSSSEEVICGMIANILDFCGNIAELHPVYFRNNARLLHFVNTYLSPFSGLDVRIKKAVDDLKHDIIYNSSRSKAPANSTANEATIESVKIRSRVFDPKRIEKYLDDAYGKLVEALEPQDE